MNNKVMNFFGSHKKPVVIAVILLLLSPVILPMPMRCFEVYTTQPPTGGGGGYLAGDVGTSERYLHCYSFMREEFRTNTLVLLPPDYVGESHIGFEWMFFPRFNRHAHYLFSHFFYELPDSSVHGLSRVFLHFSYPADYSQDNILMGASHDVFVGKVIAVTGHEDNTGLPGTQYAVEVLHTIKGNLPETITVSQDGGYRDGALVLVADGKPLLKPGAVYMLAVRENTKKGWYRLNAHSNGSKLLAEDANQGAIMSLIASDAKIRSLELAYPHEVPFEPDVRRSDTKNAFTSLPSEAKAAAVARADAARAALGANAE